MKRQSQSPAPAPAPAAAKAEKRPKDIRLPSDAAYSYSVNCSVFTVLTVKYLRLHYISCLIYFHICFTCFSYPLIIFLFNNFAQLFKPAVNLFKTFCVNCTCTANP